MSIARFFRRRGKPEAEPWQAGDLAECVKRGPWWRGGVDPVEHGPSFGERDVVKGVSEGIVATTMLSFARFEGIRFESSGFRKVRPQADELVAADPVFTYALLLRTEKVR